MATVKRTRVVKLWSAKHLRNIFLTDGVPPRRWLAQARSAALDKATATVETICSDRRHGLVLRHTQHYENGLRGNANSIRQAPTSGLADEPYKTIRCDCRHGLMLHWTTSQKERNPLRHTVRKASPEGRHFGPTLHNTAPAHRR
jgi:hypothetical protein